MVVFQSVIWPLGKHNDEDMCWWDGSKFVAWMSALVVLCFVEFKASAHSLASTI